ncbi:hypothetical protein [Streptomyces malaysiensis]|uniref:hypothetical protein n=1 Tax=Streptomyces malaysiensis TaxID=92644 RepID=UPI00371A1C5C
MKKEDADDSAFAREASEYGFPARTSSPRRPPLTRTQVGAVSRYSRKVSARGNFTAIGWVPCSRANSSNTLKPRAYDFCVLAERWWVIQEAARVGSTSSLSYCAARWSYSFRACWGHWSRGSRWRVPRVACGAGSIVVTVGPPT